MTRFGMVVNVDVCTGCYACVLACKDEHVENDWPPYTAAQPVTGHFWMKLIENERVFPQTVRVSYVPVPCMQCKDAPCLKASGGDAGRTRRDGIVVFDPEKSKSHREMMDSCPFGVVYWNQEKEGGLPQKCTFCAHLLDSGYQQPRCAEACPVDAITFGDLDDSDSEISKLVRSGATESMKPELGIDTAVRYIGLPKPVIGGSVIFGDTDECGAYVEVIVSDGDGETARTRANNYGDFLIEGLKAGKTYEIELRRPGYARKKMSVALAGDTNLGDLILER